MPPDQVLGARGPLVTWRGILRRFDMTTRVTPAMSIGITDHVWSLGELLDAATSEPAPIAPMTTPEKPILSRAEVDGPVIPNRSGRPTLRVIKGGVA